jgi:hypothetical protein
VRVEIDLRFSARRRTSLFPARSLGSQFKSAKLRAGKSSQAAEIERRVWASAPREATRGVASDRDGLAGTAGY